MITCNRCGKVRLNQITLRWRVKQGLSKTGLCRQCYLEERKNRKFEMRKQWLRSDGYYEMAIPQTHPFFCMAAQSRQTILVHRLVMAEYLGRPLKPEEVVHHINGIPGDNRIQNLSLTTLKEHSLSYRDGYAKGFKDGVSTRDKELEKQIKLLRWQIKELSETLQLKLKDSLFGV